MIQDDNLFYNEDYNSLFVKTEDNGKKLLDHIFIHMDEEENKCFMAHYKSYNDNSPIGVYRLKKIPLTQLEKIDCNLFQTDYSEETVWKRLRTGALPSLWKNFFDQLYSKL